MCVCVNNTKELPLRQKLRQEVCLIICYFYIWINFRMLSFLVTTELNKVWCTTHTTNVRYKFQSYGCGWGAYKLEHVPIKYLFYFSGITVYFQSHNILI